MCLMVSLTPATFHKSSSFTITLATRISLLASLWILLGYLCCARCNMKMTSWGCCVLVYDRSGEPVVHSNEPGLPRTDFWVWDRRADFWRRGWEEEKSVKARSKESSRGCSWELFALYSTLQVFGHISGSFSVCLQVMPRRFRQFPEMKLYLPAWRLMGSWGGVTYLLPGAWYRSLGGPSMMALSLSTVDVGQGVVGAGVW